MVREEDLNTYVCESCGARFPDKQSAFDHEQNCYSPTG